jgi:PAS domain S-box-containing protein
MNKRERRRPYRRLPLLIILMTVVAVAIGALALRYLENRLVASTGESLALAAADIANKLDLLLAERYGDIQVMAQAPALHEPDVAAMTAHLNALKKAHPAYLWLGVTDAHGRILAATDPSGVGKNRSGQDWFRAARDLGGIYVTEAEPLAEAGGAPAVAFTAPLKSPRGEFLGAVTTRVGLPVLEDVIAWTARALQAQRGPSAKIEWQFMNRDGDLILDSVLRQEGKVNLKQLALPSALLVGTAKPGYVEETHLRRHVPVVTGYAQTEGFQGIPGPRWGILVRMDRSDILAPIRMVLWRLGLAGALVFVPLLGFLLWTTRRLRKEWALAQESESLLRTIIETEPECVKLVDANGIVLRMNRAGLAMIEADSPEQVVGRPIYPLVSPEHRQAFMTLAEGVFRGESRSLAFEAVGLKGGRRWLETHAVPLRDQKGETVVMLGVTRDITERKHLEDQLRQSQKMEAIGRLAGGIAHDFNNLLTVINGYSELTYQGLSADDPNRSNVEHIKQAGARAAALTGQLLAFSRRQVLALKVLDLNAVVTNMDKMLQRVIGEDIALATVLQPGLGRVKADPGQIEQVILNLAVNARDAMPQGGKLTIETKNVELDRTYADQHIAVQPGPYVLLAVSDTGCGMDKETQARIFEPFFTTKEKGKGTGLGLSTVYGIVKQSGGYIWAYSEPGRGATFKVYLPRVEEAVATVEPRALSAESQRGSETILLVEDEAGVRMLARTVLEAKGYTVLEARHSEEALALSGQHAGPIHLMVSDVVMPGMSGRELAERVKSARPNMKVLYVSGYTDDAVVRHGVLESGTAFLQKPFTPNALARKVRETLDENARL